MPRGRVPSDEEWEAHKEQIVQLYIKDNMSREWVRKTMKHWYGFGASDKMYKNRLRKWNLRKNLTKKMYLEIEQQQTAGNNPDRFVVGGRVWDAGRVERYIKRRSPPSPLPTSSTPEALLHFIKVYFDAASPNFIWCMDTQDRLCMSKTGGINGRCRLSKFHDRLLAAVTSFTPQSNLGELERSKAVMDDCMEEMRVVLSEQDPFLLPDIFHILVQIKKRLPSPRQHPNPVTGLKLLDKVVVDYGKELSILDLGEAHPLSAVWMMLDSTLKINRDIDVFSRALELVLDEFEAQLGPNHAGSLMIQLHLFSLQEDVRWKKVVIDLLNVLEGGRGRGHGRGPGFGRLKRALETSEFGQEHVNRVTKFICRMLRARLSNTADRQMNLSLEESTYPDPEAGLVQCLSLPPVVMEADYLP
ncbi:Clr5 domain containing protein [Rhypophila decipiens]